MSKDEKHFQTIFSLLKSADASLTELVWALISKLPQNQSVYNQFESLDVVRAAFQSQNQAELSAAWSQLLDEKAVFNLLYCLKMINNTYMQNLVNPRKPSTEESKDENKEMTEKDFASQWREDFIKLGGFTHLLFVLANLNLDKIECALELVCVKTLVEIIFKFQVTGVKTKQQ